jgi:DNA-binding transcriptional ArsR family regulator
MSCRKRIFACSCRSDGETRDRGISETSDGINFHGLQFPLFCYRAISLLSNMQAKKPLPLSDSQIEEAARLFATLSEPSRLRLLQVLMDGPMTVTELVEDTGMKQGNVSKQLGILYDAHLLERNREGNFIRDNTVTQLCNLVCRKIESDALARVTALRGVLHASTKRG